MRKFRNWFLLVASLMMFSLPAPAAMDQKVKVFLTTSAYGTACGALLGLTSLVFDYRPRSIAQGASIGLYTGILFGIYVIYTHENYIGPRPSDNENYYPNSAPGPYGWQEGPRDPRAKNDVVLAKINFLNFSF
jgi:hypothetical protein